MSGFRMVYMVWYEPVKATITEKSVEHTKSGFDDANSSTNVSQNGNFTCLLDLDNSKAKINRKPKLGVHDPILPLRGCLGVKVTSFLGSLYRFS